MLALSTALLPLLTAYGPTPPPIAKDWLTPFLRFRSAGAVVYSATTVALPTVTAKVLLAPTASVTTTLAVPTARPVTLSLPAALTVTSTTLASLLVALYGPVPPPMSKVGADPGATTNGLAAVV